MTRMERMHIVGGDRMSDNAPRHLAKQEFARRLYTRMVNAGLTQSELARLTSLSRNNISTYIRGQCFPTRGSLDKLAAALRCKSDDLLPNLSENAIQQEQYPDMALKASGADPDRSWLTINRAVKTSLGIKILALLNDDQTSD